MSDSVEWETPQDLYDKYSVKYNLTLDVAATRQNAKCTYFYTKEDDGLTKDWTKDNDGNIWMNCPYSRGTKDWVKKAYETAQNSNKTVVALLPVKFDTKWWANYIWDFNLQRPRFGVECEFITGRVRFGDGKGTGRFASVVVIFHGQK